jgi:IPT/TIG domain
MLKMKLLELLLVTAFAMGCGGYTSGNGTRPSSTPNIAMLAPASATAGGEAFMLTVKGTGFANNGTVYWNSSTLTTTFVSAQELTVEIPASDIAAAGTASVYVKNPGTGVYASGVNSNAVSFMIQ